MPLPHHSLAVSGGCNCGAIRFSIQIPRLEDRPLHPSSDDSGPVYLPFVATDHCNDCRRATGSAIAFWICTPSDMITASLVPRSAATLNPKASEREQSVEETRGPWLPAETIFQPGPASADSFLSFYESSAGRRRSFCGRCGTSLTYAAFPMPPDWPDMLDIVLGTIDRQDLENDALAPERQLWWDYGIDWAKSLTAQGIGSLPRHKNYRMNEFSTGDQPVS